MENLRKMVACPYCEHIEVYDVNDLMTLAICFVDEGGCDKWFVIEREDSIQVIAKKIEGEED